jgi:hypothetical protein
MTARQLSLCLLDKMNKKNEFHFLISIFKY